ncbi:MAG: flagellar basal-body rod protein FlgF, partial [Bacteroidetes bacterium]
PDVRQGFLEQSNVDAIAAMTEMIEHYRLFETQQRSIRTDDELLGRVTRELGRF